MDVYLEEAERLVAAAYGPANGNPDEMVSSPIQLDDLTLLNLLAVSSGDLPERHVACQSHLRLLHDIAGSEPPESPELAAFAESVQVLGGQSLTNLVYGQGRYNVPSNVSQSPSDVASTRNFGWFSARTTIRRGPETETRPQDRRRRPAERNLCV